MFRLGVISDVHADVHSLERALKRMREMECGQIVCLGDIPDYGLFVCETVALLKAEGIPTIRGNHCRWSVSERKDVSRTVMAWLSELPLRWDHTIEGVRIAARHGSTKGDMDGLYPDQVKVSELDAHLDRAEADVLLVGHTHIPMRKNASRGRLVCNPGALLSHPADGYEVGIWDKDTETWVEPPLRSPGTFGVLELPKKTFRVYRARDGSEVDL